MMAYELHETPDHPGLWKDCDGALWVYDGCDLRLVKGDGAWAADGSTVDIVSVKLYTPFTEMEVKEKDQ